MREVVVQGRLDIGGEKNTEFRGEGRLPVLCGFISIPGDEGGPPCRMFI